MTTHSHGPEGAHAHGGTAFTTWLDFDLARQHADAVHAALARKSGGEEKGLGGKCVVFDPCGAPPPEEDFLAAMRSNLEALQSIQPAP